MRSDDLHASYLEVLDDEYRDLDGAVTPAADALRERYAEARRKYARTRDSARGTASDAGREADARNALEAIEAEFRHDLLKRLHAAGRAAICFSGGGIRSATFGLGILQGLAAHSRDDTTTRPRLLGEFDFLSTVSGGGYLGSWFSAWAARLSAPRDGSADVIRALAKNVDTAFDPEPPSVRHLRSYSNYLIPRLGLFSGDTWAVIGTVIRNMFLNWLVLVPLLAFALLIPEGALRVAASTPPVWLLWTTVIAALGAGVLATAYVGYDLPSAGNARGNHAMFVMRCLAPLLIAAILLNTFWIWLPTGIAGMPWWDVVALGRQHVGWTQLAAFGALMHGGGMLAGILVARVTFHRPARRTGLIATACAFLTGAAGGGVMYLLIRLLEPHRDTLRSYVCVAPPLVVAIFLLAGTLLAGLTSYITEDKDREWWARAGGTLLAVALAWLAFSAIVLYSHDIIAWLTWKASATAGVISGWITSKLSSSADTSGPQTTTGPPSTAGRAKSIGARLALPLFLFLLAAILARGNAALLALVPLPPLAAWGVVAAAYLAVGFGASYFINVNSFSLHAMYKLRLERAYLGASNPDRETGAHRFTGFDERDDLELHRLPRGRPLHVVNMALNLVGGKTLAWQQRKAESFTATRLHAGSCRLGYRPAATYGGKYGRTPERKRALSLGTAMTISGAAASPNMGYNSSPLLTLVMTLFNARLGWWLGNPIAPGGYWRYPGPVVGIRTHLDEALGLTDDTNRWIYLSDGGHFENLGLYEMVLRRCRTIVVSDAGADPAFAFDDIGNAVRKIRVDLGIPIEFSEALPKRFTEDGQAAARHCAVGEIRYSAVDGSDAPVGVLVYIKASLTGDEPLDVRHYASQHAEFPHETTTDQFFDESQFESYRRLGLHIIERICDARGGISPPDARMDLATFVAQARAH
jgi:hypothetical protein